MKGSNGLQWINFNHDQSLVSMGTRLGCRVFSINNEIQCVFSRESKDLGIVQLQNSNLLLLTGASSRFPPNRLCIYDVQNSLNLLQIELKSRILNLHWVKQWLVVILQDSVYVYIIDESPRKRFVFETCSNSEGLADLHVGETCLLAIPGRNLGQVQIVKLSDAKNVAISLILAHSSGITCLKLSDSGKLLATASEKGTLIRIWDVSSSRLLTELRRGTDQARIYSLAFSSEETRLAVSSDKGTIHVFNLISTDRISSSPPLSGNRISVFSPLSSYLPKYFSSEWSWASFSLPIESQCILKFYSSQSGSNECIVVLCSDGSLYKYRLSEANRTFTLETFQVLWHGTANPGLWNNIKDFWDDWFEEGLI